MNTEVEKNSSYTLRDPRINLESDVILAPQTRQMFEEAIGAMRHHKTIYSDWGFDAVDAMGRNMILNLYGPPGTGKTLAAEALAGTLKRKYFHIGISELESKYVGETAKNISAAFDVASMENAILFFDEADTLLGARLSSVTQGIDNEINAMRSTLLIELERFNGVVIFATNFARNYDNAFVSRIRYHIEFKLPDLDGRRQLFDRLLVEKIPLEENRLIIIDRAANASEGLSGREIRTVLRTAFPKAFVDDEQRPLVRWPHLEDAISEVRLSNSNIGKSHQADYTQKRRDVAASRQLLGIAESQA